jgi:hypothetical protein
VPHAHVVAAEQVGEVIICLLRGATVSCCPAPPVPHAHVAAAEQFGEVIMCLLGGARVSFCPGPPVRHAHVAAAEQFGEVMIALLARQLRHFVREKAGCRGAWLYKRMEAVQQDRVRSQSWVAKL